MGTLGIIFAHTARGFPKKQKNSRKPHGFRLSLAPQTGFEPATFRLGGGRSIQLSYWGKYVVILSYKTASVNGAKSRAPYWSAARVQFFTVARRRDQSDHTRPAASTAAARGTSQSRMVCCFQGSSRMPPQQKNIQTPHSVQPPLLPKR